MKKNLKKIASVISGFTLLAMSTTMVLSCDLPDDDSSSSSIYSTYAQSISSNVSTSSSSTTANTSNSVPDIATGEYVYRSWENVIVTIDKENHKATITKYASYEAYLRKLVGTATSADYASVSTDTYSDGAYSLTLDSKTYKIKSGTELHKVSEIKDYWAKPVDGLYVSNRTYTLDNSAMYLYLQVADSSSSYKIYKSSSNSETSTTNLTLIYTGSASSYNFVSYQLFSETVDNGVTYGINRGKNASKDKTNLKYSLAATGSIELTAVSTN
ncbi:MAG: hypothetical protein K6F15_02910 [Treponema sp.]|nr:hypothetical protein [Treponema sp.]